MVRSVTDPGNTQVHARLTVMACHCLQLTNWAFLEKLHCLAVQTAAASAALVTVYYWPFIYKVGPTPSLCDSEPLRAPVCLATCAAVCLFRPDGAVLTACHAPGRAWCTGSVLARAAPVRLW